MKIVTFYLPQYYTFPENDKWWGKGFTEWTNVKKSKPLFKNHYQPTVPLNENYYCLDDINTMKWQAELAKKYGIYGFCFYHYWFGEGRQLMQKPVEAWLEHKEINFPFCLCWANHNWSRTWVGGDKDILMDMRYGDENEWEKHFHYLLQFFKDKRYIYINNKPVLVIYLPQKISCLQKMLLYFKKRAIESGLNGLTIISQNFIYSDKTRNTDELLDYRINYEPNRIRAEGILNNIKNELLWSVDLLKYRFKGIIKSYTKGKLFHVRTHNYDLAWKCMLKRKVIDKKEIAGAFVKCDVTPRRQDRAIIFRGASPNKFEHYMNLLIKKVESEFSTDWIFVSAWNEWGEGMYLEPDEKYKYGYLEAIKQALEENNEFPTWND